MKISYYYEKMIRFALDMRQVVHLIIIYAALLTLVGCGGGQVCEAVAALG